MTSMTTLAGGAYVSPLFAHADLAMLLMQRSLPLFVAVGLVLGLLRCIRQERYSEAHGHRYAALRPTAADWYVVPVGYALGTSLAGLLLMAIACAFLGFCR